MRPFILLMAAAIAGCHCHPAPPPAPPTLATLAIANRTPTPTTVFVSFAADSQVRTLSFCKPDGGNPCSFPLAQGATQPVAFSAYLNITLAFGAPPSCGTTAAEVTLNTPSGGQDTTDVSLVDGYSNKIEIDVTGSGGAQTLGPPSGKTGNEGVFGVFPSGCDICVARQKPPCGITPCGSSPNDGGQECGCKRGGQYAPSVPCQYGAPHGQSYVVALMP